MKKLLLLAALSITLLPGCFRTRAEIAREKEENEVRASLQQNVVESSQGMERLQAEIGRLNGRIEELEHQRRKEMSNLGATREASEKNVGDLRGKVDELQKTQTALFEELKRLKEENVQLLKSMERPRAAPPSPQKKSAKEKEGSSANAGAGNFESALTAYKAKDYDAATSAFRSFLEMNPKSKKALDARYYLGDSLYRQKEYTDAIMEFSVLHERTPATTLGRKSTLRIAESFQAMGKDKDAKAFAQILVQSSPNSPEAKRAKKMLR